MSNVHLIRVVERDRNNRAEKYLQKMTEIFPKFSKGHKFKDIRNSAKPKQDKYEQNCTLASHYQTAENQREREKSRQQTKKNVKLHIGKL